MPYLKVKNHLVNVDYDGDNNDDVFAFNQVKGEITCNGNLFAVISIIIDSNSPKSFSCSPLLNK